MKPFTVTIIHNGARHCYDTIAACWFGAWSNAVDTFGVAALVIVKPFKGN